MNTESSNKITRRVLLLGAIMLCGCESLTVDTSSLLVLRFQGSEILGFVAGLERPLPRYLI